MAAKRFYGHREPLGLIGELSKCRMESCPHKPRYAYMPAEIIEALPEMSGKACKIAVALAVFMDKQGKCWPSSRTLMETSGIRRRQSVTAALNELVGLGLLTIKKDQSVRNLYTWRAEVYDLRHER